MFLNESCLARCAYVRLQSNERIPRWIRNAQRIRHVTFAYWLSYHKRDRNSGTVCKGLNKATGIYANFCIVRSMYASGDIRIQQ
jgi:hypothetical protein